VHDEPGYAILGKGYIIGGAHILVDLLGYELANSWRFKSDALATFLINQVAKVDPSVSPFEGDGFTMYARRNTLYLCLPPKSPVKYADQSRLRTEIIRSMWQLCDEKKGNEKRFLKQLAKIRGSSPHPTGIS